MNRPTVFSGEIAIPPRDFLPDSNLTKLEFNFFRFFFFWPSKSLKKMASFDV